ncbi:SpoIIE family protein phosphatase [Kineococcus rubinsiae]|uniref:SpoIIE family protein phosphatase n=1 Tax=Kineococcus rubinsiae TaxID=2609562 RepID=UPI0027E4B329|nr:SpoIIE family protein phosphatase [Kineococcus rubinsiae]
MSGTARDDGAPASPDEGARRLRWEVAIAAAGVGGFDWDLRTGVLTWDERMVELFGYDAAGFEPTFEAFTARLHPEDLPRVLQNLQQCIDGCGEFAAEYRVLLPGGATRWVQARGRAVPDAAGRAVRVLGAGYDTTAARDSDARVARVLESMTTAFFSLDREWRFTYVNAEAERLLGRPAAELLGGDVWALFPAALGSDFETHYRAVAAGGEPGSFEAYYPPPLDAWYEVRAWPDPDGVSVYFLDVTARRRAQAEAEAAREAAEAASAELEAALQRARANQDAAEATAQRLQLLARVSEDLTSTLDAEEAVARLTQNLVPALADWCLVSLVDDHGQLRDLGSWHADPDLRGLVGGYQDLRMRALRSRSFLDRALRGGRQVLIPSGAVPAISEVLASPQARAVLQRLAPESAAVLPVRARGRTCGLVTLFRGADRPPLAGEDLLTATEIADRAGLALDNARLFTQQHRMAEGLQRSLLTAPVEPDHTQVAVRYQPAAEAAQVGGDWYDAFLQPDRATVLVIGDVMGHDNDAAAAMGQLRGLLRGIAYTTGGTPAEVLSGLDAAMQGLQVDTTATALVARIEQSPAEHEQGLRQLRFSSAGHLPPLLLGADGTVSTLDEDRPDLLLGIDPGYRRADSVRLVESGSTVLLYTDGLVERRGEAIDTGLDRLRAAVAELAGATLEDLCDGVLARMIPARAEDDVALVAVRLHAEDRPRPPDAGPEVAGPTPPVEAGSLEAGSLEAGSLEAGPQPPT